MTSIFDLAFNMYLQEHGLLVSSLSKYRGGKNSVLTSFLNLCAFKSLICYLEPIHIEVKVGDKFCRTHVQHGHSHYHQLGYGIFSMVGPKEQDFLLKNQHN